METRGGRRTLRIGIVVGGRVVEERLLRKRKPVRLSGFTALRWRRGAWRLRFRPGMRGKLGIGEGVLDLAGLVAQGLTHRQGAVHEVPLEGSSRGKLQLGETTLLFQFVKAPARAHVQLPASMRRGLFGGLDRPFAATLLGSLGLQTLAVALLVTGDYPAPPQGLQTLPDRWHTVLVEPKPPAPEPPPVEAPVEAPAEEEGTQLAEAPKPKAKPKKPGAKPKKPRSMREDLADRTILGVVGSMGGGGSLFNGLKDPTAQRLVEHAFRGTQLALAGPNLERKDKIQVGKRPGQIAGVDGTALLSQGGGAVRTSGKREPRVRLRVKAAPPGPQIGLGTLSPRAIASVIKRRRGEIEGCYERGLKRRPGLKGKLRVQFTVQASGRVRGARLLEDSMGDAGVARCILGKLGRWRFRKPEGGSVTFAFPFVFSAGD